MKLTVWHLNKIFIKNRCFLLFFFFLGGGGGGGGGGAVYRREKRREIRNPEKNKTCQEPLPGTKE